MGKSRDSKKAPTKTAKEKRVEKKLKEEELVFIDTEPSGSFLSKWDEVPTQDYDKYHEYLSDLIQLVDHTLKQYVKYNPDIIHPSRMDSPYGPNHNRLSGGRIPDDFIREFIILNEFEKFPNHIENSRPATWIEIFKDTYSTEHSGLDDFEGWKIACRR